MEYVALYRKYRPRKLDEVYGQKYIVDIVKNSISSERFMHAYLFSGPRGTGKTTIAKLLAKIVNCSDLKGFDPCDKCESCKLINDRSNPDIIEIDAASNNGVDEIRTIRDSVVLMPSVSKYKVYIIDEVHMLSTSAFNALLKTLEEPPKHVIFILATTELNKVPETIVSRCQCYDFKRISVEDIVLCLTKICEKEKIEAPEEVLSLIAKYCNGGMRDSIGLLDKLLSYSNVITKDLFYDVVGLVDTDIIEDMYLDIINGNVDKVFNLIEKLVNYGKSVELITEQLLNYLRSLSLDSSKINVSNEKFILIVNGVSDIFNGLKDSYNQMLFFEIEMLKLISKLKDDTASVFETESISQEINNVQENALKMQKNSPVEQTTIDKEEKEIDDNKHKFVKRRDDFDIIINNAFALADKSLKSEIVDKWNGFNDYVHNKEFSSLVSYFLDSVPQVVGKEDIIMSSSYDAVVHNANKDIAKLELLFNLVMEKSYNIVFVTDDEWNDLKNKYVEDIKSGKKYEYIESTKESNIINLEATADLAEVAKTARSIFGKEIVEVK